MECQVKATVGSTSPTSLQETIHKMQEGFAATGTYSGADLRQIFGDPSKSVAVEMPKQGQQGNILSW